MGPHYRNFKSGIFCSLAFCPWLSPSTPFFLDTPTILVQRHKLEYTNVSCGKAFVDALPFSAETPVEHRRKWTIEKCELIKCHSLFSECVSTALGRDLFPRYVSSCFGVVLCVCISMYVSRFWDEHIQYSFGWVLWPTKNQIPAVPNR